MEKQQLLDLALDSVPLGTFRWGQVSGELSWNRQHFLMLGLDPETATPTYELLRSAYILRTSTHWPLE